MVKTWSEASRGDGERHEYNRGNESQVPIWSNNFRYWHVGGN